HTATHSFPTRRSSDLRAMLIFPEPQEARRKYQGQRRRRQRENCGSKGSALNHEGFTFTYSYTMKDQFNGMIASFAPAGQRRMGRSEEHTSELQSRENL